MYTAWYFFNAKIGKYQYNWFKTKNLILSSEHLEKNWGTSHMFTIDKQETQVGQKSLIWINLIMICYIVPESDIVWRVSRLPPWPPSWLLELFVCVEVLRPSQPNGVMLSAVSLPNHTFTGQA